MTEIRCIQVPIPFAVKWVNSYLIVDSVPTLIDAGFTTDDGFRAIEAAAAEHLGSLSHLRRIIVTHGHGDHIGLAGRIARLSGAEVFVHPWDRTDVLAGGEVPLMERSSRLRSFLLEGGLGSQETGELMEMVLELIRRAFSHLHSYTALNGDEVFRFDDFELQTIHTPGHTPGSVVLFNPADGTLFSGDGLIEEITFNPLIEPGSGPGRSGYNSLDSYLESLNTIEDLNVTTVHPGHGSSYSDVGSVIARLRTHHLERREKILRVLRESRDALPAQQGATRFQITMRLFPEARGLELYHRLAAIYVHLVDLEKRGLVLANKREDGCIEYTATS